MTAEAMAAQEARLDELTLAVLGPLRTSKQLDREALGSLKQLLDSLRNQLQGKEMVPRSLVGKAWFIFTSMLAEASHAKDPAPILSEAWEIEDKLAHLFGPDW